MTEIIQRMIDRAIESGSISMKQKNMIIAKARKNGDDVDEVEIMLETIPIEEEPIQDLPQIKNAGKIRKCSNCGATISGNAMTCPECGFVLVSESNNSAVTRNYTHELQESIKAVKNDPRASLDYDGDDDIIPDDEIARVIKEFSIPVAQEGLTQFMIYCYSRYEASESFTEEKKAWLSKAKECYLLLFSVPDADSATKAIIDKYAFILEKKATSTL